MNRLRRSLLPALAFALAALALPASELRAQCSLIRVGPQTLPAGTVGTPYGQTVTQAGGAAGTMFSISAGALPAGLNLNSATGLIDGTPTAAGTALFTVRATEPTGGCFGGRTYAIAITCGAITVTPPATTSGTAGVAFSETFTQGGGALPVTFTLNSGTLPTGITLDPSGLLSGTTTESGVFPITVLVTDVNGCTGTSPTYTLTIVPAAVAETYPQTVVGNMGIDTSTGTTYSVLTNDAGTGLTASLVSGTTANGGSVTLVGATGTFTYQPPRGFEGADTFQYTVTGAGGTSGPATVTINVAGMVWFVDAAAAPGGDGRRTTPYATLAAFVAVNTGVGSDPGANDRIFLFENAAPYAGTLPLLDGQRLVGQDATGTFAAAVAYTVPDTTLNVPVLDSANGVKATIANAGDAVVLATGTGNGVRGVSLSVSSGAGIFGSGALGTVSVDETAIATSGSAAGLSLTNQEGALTFSNGSITGDGSTAGVRVSGGGGLVQVLASTVSKTAWRLVDVQGKTGGGVSFSTGSLSVTGAATDAVVLVNNASTQVDFAAGLSVTTTAGRGLVVDNSTTTTFGGSGSTINATGGAALDVSGTNFLGDAAFASASSTGSSGEGIRLVNVSGNVSILGGSISGSTGAAFLVSGGSSNVTYAGSVSKTNAGRAVDVQGRAGGTVTLSGAVAADGASTGILVSGPTAASTVAFTGTVELGNNVVRLAGGTALTVDHNAQAGAVTSFASLTVRTLGQQGIDASNGGSLNTASGEVDVQAGRALRANGITLGVTLGGLASIGSPAEGVSLTNVSGSLGAGVLSATNPTAQGILLLGSSLNVNVGTTSVSGTGTQRILVGTSTGNVNFGNATLQGGTDAVSLQNNPGGTRTFASLDTSGNSGVGFLHAAGGGAVTVIGATTITNPGGTGIDIQGNAAAIGFAGATVNKGLTAGTGVSLAGNTAGPSFGALNVTASNGTGIAINASGITTAGGTVSATNGPAISATGAVFSGSLASASSTNSPTQGINLANCSGSYSVGGGTITGAAGTAFAVNGGSAAFAYAGSVTQNAAQRVVDVQSTTGGTITVASATGGAASTGVNVAAANGNVSFTNLTLGTSGSRMSSQAVTITGGTGTYALGTVSIFTTGGTARGIGATNADGGINATAGTVDAAGAAAIDVDGPVGLTTLGMTLTTVAANGGANGLLLRDTDGTFTVTGTGGAGTGGTIQSCTVRGARFQSAAGVSLSWMTFTNNGTNQDPAATCGDALNGTNTNCGAGIDLQSVNGVSLSNVTVTGGTQIGINGNSVTNLAMSSVTVQNAGNEVSEDGVQLVNLLGTCSVAGSTFISNFHRQLEVQNASGTLTSLAITGSTFDRGSYVSTSAQGILIAGHGTAAMTASVKGSTLQRNFGSGFFGQSIDTANLSLTVGDVSVPANGNTFTDNSLTSQILADNASSNVATVDRNTATVSATVTSGATPVTFRKSSPSTGNLTGSFANNTIGSGAPQSGNNCAGCNGLSITNEGMAGTLNLSVTGNTIQHVNQRGMEVILQASAPTNVVVTGNTIQSPDSTVGQAIFGQSGNDPGDLGTLCMDVTGNVIGGLWDTGIVPTGRNIRLRQSPSGGNTPFRLRNIAGTTATDANNTLNANNTNAVAACTALVGFTTGSSPCF